MSETREAKLKGKINLDSWTAQELADLIEAAEAMRRNKLEEEKPAFISEMREKAAQRGLSLDALFPSRGSPRKRSRDGGTAPAKYRGPGGEEWSGRGPPAQLADRTGSAGPQARRISRLSVQPGILKKSARRYRPPARLFGHLIGLTFDTGKPLKSFIPK